MNAAFPAESSTSAIKRRFDSDASSYRALLSIPRASNATRHATEQLYVWLREKGWDTSLAQTLHLQGSSGELSVVHHQTGSAELFRLRLREESRIGEWRTELTTAEYPDDEGWMTITVVNSEGRFVAVPRIAAYILDVVDAYDGPSMLTSEPTLVAESGVEELAEQLCSLDRSGLMIVAGTADDSSMFENFRQQVTVWTRHVRGLARVVVLDPRATAALPSVLGSRHAVAPWTLRTFHPDVDPAVELDSRRHRIMGTSALADMSSAQIQRLFGRAARAHASARPLLPEMTRATRTLARLEDKLILSPLSVVEPDRQAAAPTGSGPGDRPGSTDDTAEQASDRLQPADTPHAEHQMGLTEHLATLEMMREALGLDLLEEQLLRDLASKARRGEEIESAAVRIERELRERQSHVEELETELDVYKGIVDEYYFEGTQAQLDLSRLSDEVQWLRSRLREEGDFGAANGDVPSDAYTDVPESFQQLLSRIDEFTGNGIVFTGDVKRTASLDDHDPLGKLARTTWEILLVLSDYLRSRQSQHCGSGIEGYLRNTPTGYRNFPPKKFAATETAKTMDSFKKERYFSVPTTVDKSGQVLMKAHFKLGRVGMVSPRMYLLDRFLPDGKIYVGYIGEHLTNTHTS